MRIGQSIGKLLRLDTNASMDTRENLHTCVEVDFMMECEYDPYYGVWGNPHNFFWLWMASHHMKSCHTRQLTSMDLWKEGIK